MFNTKGEITFFKDGDGQQPGIEVSYSKLLKKSHGIGEERTENQYFIISISITDASSDMESILSGYKELGQDEKAVKVKGIYEGIERMEKNSTGCISSGIGFLVNKRFDVGIRAERLCELAVLYQIIDSMNLESLPK